MHFLKSFTERAAKILNYVSCAALVILMLMITINVILRTVFKSPIMGTYDMTGFLTIIIIGCGLSFCSLQDGHIEISFFVDKLGTGIQKWITLAGRIATCAVLFLFAFALFSRAGRIMSAGEVSVTTKTPLYIFVYLMALCFVIFALSVAIKAFEGFVAAGNKSAGDKKVMIQKELVDES